MGSSSHMKRKWAIQANLEYTISFSLVYILHYASWNCQPWNAGIRWLAPPKNGTEKNIERRTLRSNEKKNLLPARHIPQAITTTKQINRNQLKFQCVLNAMEWKHRKWKQIVVVIKNYEKKNINSGRNDMFCLLRGNLLLFDIVWCSHAWRVRLCEQIRVVNTCIRARA